MAAFALAIAAACERSGDDITPQSSSEVGIVSLYATQGGSGEESTRVENNIWESSDFIGLSTSDESESNMCYMVDPNGTMTNSDDDYTISVVDSKSYYAYYPYDVGVADDIKSVDLDNQNTMTSDELATLDLMWAKQEDISVSQPQVYMIFERQLVQMTVSLTIANDTFDESKGLAVKGVITQGSFNVKTGEMSAGGTQTALLNISNISTMNIPDGSGATTAITTVVAEGLFLPMAECELMFTYYNTDGDALYCSMNSGEWSKGVSHSYTITCGCESRSLSEFSSASFPAESALWVVNDWGVTTASDYDGLRSALAVDEVIGNEVMLVFPNLTAIPSRALEGCTDVVSLYLPRVTSAGSYALSGCSSLVSLYAPELMYISGYLCSGCSSLSYISMDRAYMVGDGAFMSCSSLSGISMSELVSVGEEAFASCSNIGYFTAPQLAWVGAGALKGCTSLKSVTLSCDSVSGVTNLEGGWVDSSRASSIALTISAILPSGVSISDDTITYADGSSDTFSSVDDESLMLSDFVSGMDTSALGTTWTIMDSYASSANDFLELNSVICDLAEPITLIFPVLKNLPDYAFNGTSNISSIYLLSIEEIGCESLYQMPEAEELIQHITLGCDGSIISSIDETFINSALSESIELTILSTLESPMSCEGNKLTLSNGAFFYFKTLNGVGFKLYDFMDMYYDSSLMPRSTSWYITDSGTPESDEFTDLVAVLDYETRDISLTFSELSVLPRSALSGADNLYSISMPKASRIYYEALSSCEDLEYVDMPCVTTISDSAFALSSNLKSVSLPSAMVIGSSLFQLVASIETLDLGSQTYITSYDCECFDAMATKSTILTTCNSSKFTSDMSISGNTIVFQTDGKYSTTENYTFEAIIQNVD